MQGYGSTDPLMVVGGQWGDEGKGKIVDLLSGGFAAVVRYNGGHNAGHTVRVGERHFALHLVPSGIIHPGARCYMGSGMVVDPVALAEEIAGLERQDVTVGGRLLLSPRATLILPTHRALDLAREGRRGRSKIGTTGRGIGPAYQDAAQRRGLRAWMLPDAAGLTTAVRTLMEDHNRELEALSGAAPVDLDDALAELIAAAGRIAPLVGEIGPELRRHASRGEPVLFEGAQGVLLDLTWGTYPFVTSSSCLPGSAATSCGIGPRLLGPVLAVMKAYATRVGEGPFPTEDHGPGGELLRERGGEYGTTTGRPRRCGWFDAVAARYAVETAGIDAVAMTKMDILDGLERLKVAVAYEREDGSTLADFPADADELSRIRPLYEEVPGWSEPTQGLTRPADLPAAAEAYLRFLEERIGAPIAVVSTGPRRAETMVRGASPMAVRVGEILRPA